MPSIIEQDIKLLKSQNLTDYDDGGQKITGNEVLNGVVNELFPDISMLDRTYGRVSIRKAYPAVRSNNDGVYLGGHIILTNPPTDPSVNVTMFTTKSWTDNRAAARAALESYSIQGPSSRWLLFSTHIAGQKVLRLFSLSNAASKTQGTDDATPEVGTVMMLSIEGDGFTPHSQFVRITKILERKVYKYTYGGGGGGGGGGGAADFYKDVVTLEIGNALRYDFPGLEPNQSSFWAKPPTVVRDTSVADAAQYYSVKPVKVDVVADTHVIDIGNPFIKIIPSAQTEEALIDQVAGSDIITMKKTGAGNISVSASGFVIAGGASATFNMLRPVLPGTLTVTMGGHTYNDDYRGNLVDAASSSPPWTGTVNYVTGEVTMTYATLTFSGTISATAEAAAPVFSNAHTAVINVTNSNRQYNYTQSLDPLPAPGMVSVSYRAQNKCYNLKDDGHGNITGTGTGHVDYSTGGVIITLPTPPDAGSAVIFSWGTPVGVITQTGSLVVQPPKIVLQLANTGIIPSTFTATWSVGGVTKTVTCDTHGNLSGDATGRLMGATGQVYLIPNVVPDSSSQISCSYTWGAVLSEPFHPTKDGGGFVELHLAHAPVKPGSITINYNLKRELSFGMGIDPPYIVRDTFYNVNKLGAVSGEGVPSGGAELTTSSVNYATGVLYFNPAFEGDVLPQFYGWQNWAEPHVLLNLTLAGYTGAVPAAQATGHGWAVISLFFNDATLMTVSYMEDAVTGTTVTGELHAFPSLKLDLTPTLKYSIIPSSIDFTAWGRRYYDRAGVIYTNSYESVPGTAVLTGSDLAVGSVNYTTGEAIIDVYGTTGTGNTIDVHSLALLYGEASAAMVFFRVEGAPIAAGNFYLQGNQIDGTHVTWTADLNGYMNTANGIGTVDWTTGIVRMAFGRWALETDPDWSPALTWAQAMHHPTDATLRWLIKPVLPSTLRFNTVLSSYIPLDGDILGMDNVRLPVGGDVPGYRVGNVAVVHNTQKFTLPNPVVAGSTYSVGRGNVAYIRLYSADGVPVPSSEYTVDKTLGQVTMSNPLSVGSLTQPWYAEHRIEDMSLISDVQITGPITFQRKVKHNYPKDTSYLSAALIVGDLQARVTNVFEQTTWPNPPVWQATPYLGSPSAQYNDTVYPIVVSNNGCIHESWAIVFTNSTSFTVYGMNSGAIATGNVSTNLAPINPDTGTPYFTLDHLGWGSNWAGGNVLRFDTISADYPVWFIRTTLQSDPVAYTDDFRLEIRGDSN